MNWHVFKGLPARNLLAVRQLENQGFEISLPMLKTVRQSRRPQDTKSPLFPGHSFVFFGDSASKRRSINATRDVSYLIAGQHRPISIDDRIINEVLKLVTKVGLVSFCHSMNPGDTLEFISSPLPIKLANWRN